MDLDTIEAHFFKYNNTFDGLRDFQKSLTKELNCD